MSVEIDEEENPTLIVNIDDPAAKSAIRRVIIWLGTLGGLTEWIEQSATRQTIAAVVGTAAIATAGTATVTEIIRDGPQTKSPPVVTQRTVTLSSEPRTTVTATIRSGRTPDTAITRAPSTSAPARRERSTGPSPIATRPTGLHSTPSGGRPPAPTRSQTPRAVDDRLLRLPTTEPELPTSQLAPDLSLPVPTLDPVPTVLD